MADGKTRFGPFELDTKAGELARSGRRVRLQDKPLKLLVALVERPHEVVTREELRARLWPPNMVVEFDDGLNTAVNKLRRALGDAAGAPRYVETVGRRGYRFIGQLADDGPVLEAPIPARARIAAATAKAIALPRRPGPSSEAGDVATGAGGAVSGDAAAAARERGRPNWQPAAVLAFGSALFAGVLIVAAFVLRDPSLESPVTRFTIVIPSAQRIEAGAYQSVAISPSSGHIAYVANGRVYLRPRDAAEARPVEGTENQGPLVGVLFSPDGEWMAYYSARYRELRKVPRTGGAPIRVAAAQGYLGGSWGADGRIVFAQSEGVYAVAETGGVPELLVAADRERGERLQNPVLLPNGRGVLFTVAAESEPGRRIVVQSLGVGGRRVTLASGTDARYLDTGHLVFGDGGTLVVEPFDLASLRTTGAPLAVAQGLLQQSVIQSADFAVSRSGTLVYRTAAQPLRTLVWVDREGNREIAEAPPRAYNYPRISPDGARIAVSLSDEDRDIFAWDSAERTFTRLTFNADVDMLPVWVLDSGRIVFGSRSGGRSNISRRSADGTGGAEVLVERQGDMVLQPNSVTPSATHLVFRHATFVGAAGGPDNDLWILPLDGSGPAKPLLATERQELNAEISPDGRWLAYQSNETGPFEIYIRPFPEIDGGVWQASSGGGIQPLWAPDGGQLFYLASERMMSVSVSGGATPSIGAARVVLASLPFLPYERSGRAYDLSPDGQRFLFVNTTTTISDDPFEGADRYEVVLNWSEELKRLARARGTGVVIEP